MNTNSNSSTLSSPDSKLTHPQIIANRDLLPSRSFNQLDLPTNQQKKSIALIYVEQARVYYQEHNWHKAILACKHALEIASDTVDAYKMLGDILYRQGKPAEALGVYARALIIDPNFAPVYAQIGALYIERQDWKKALDYYQQAVILDPNCAETYRGLAQVWEELGEEEKALECFCRAIELNPQILAVEEYFRFGKELYHQGKIKEASILYIRGIELNPLAEAELEQLVQILEELGEWEQAVAYYHQLMSLTTFKSDTANQNKVKLESSARKPIKKMLFGSQSALKRSAKNTQNNIPLLPQDATQKLLPKAESQPKIEHANSADVSKISLQQPDSALSWNNLGSVYAQQKQWEKAISCYQEALQLNPDFAKSYRNLARVYHNLGQELKSAFYWYEAFIIEPEIVKSEEYYSLAKKFLQYQQSEKAIACLQRAVELKPDFKKARLTLDRLTNSSH